MTIAIQVLGTLYIFGCGFWFARGIDSGERALLPAVLAWPLLWPAAEGVRKVRRWRCDHKAARAARGK